MLHFLLAALMLTNGEPTKSQPDTTAPVALAVAAMPAELVEQSRLVATLKLLPTKRAVRSDEAHRDGLIETQNLLIAQLKALGYEVHLDEIDTIGIKHDPAKPLYNIWVEIPGRGAAQDVDKTVPTPAKGTPPLSEKDRKSESGSGTKPPADKQSKKSKAESPKLPGTLIVGAHIDAVPLAPGADDDGTGVAAILEMARILKDRPMRDTVRLCLFNLEEAGLVGATIHARHVKEEIIDTGKGTVSGMIAIDMLGFYSTEPGSQKSPIPEMDGFKPPDVADFIGMATVFKHRKFSQSLAKAMRATSPGLKVVVVDFLPLPIPDIMRSDHAPFLTLGIPSVIVSDTAEFRSKHYHKPTDTIDTLDLDRFTTTVKGLVGAVHELAGPLETVAQKTPLPAKDEQAKDDKAK